MKHGRPIETDGNAQDWPGGLIIFDIIILIVNNTHMTRYEENREHLGRITSLNNLSGASLVNNEFQSSLNFLMEAYIYTMSLDLKERTPVRFFDNRSVVNSV